MKRILITAALLALAGAAHAGKAPPVIPGYHAISPGAQIQAECELEADSMSTHGSIVGGFFHAHSGGLLSRFSLSHSLNYDNCMRAHGYERN